MATVHFSGSLAQYTDGLESVTVEAGRVLELVREVNERFPALASPLEIMAIAVDGEVYQDADYVQLSADSEIHFVPRIAGG